MQTHVAQPPQNPSHQQQRQQTQQDEAVVNFWRQEVSDFLHDDVRVNAALNSHLIAREIGADTVMESLERDLLPLEVSDAVLESLATSLGESEFGSSRRAFSCLVWLLENPEKNIRRAAVKSVLQHANRGRPLVFSRGLLNTAQLESCVGLIDHSDEQQKGGDAEQVSLISALCDPSQFKGFFQRISVCELLSLPVNSGLSPEQEAEIVLRLACDQVPQVRLAAAENLGGLGFSVVAGGVDGKSGNGVDSKHGRESNGKSVNVAAMAALKCRRVPAHVAQDLMVDPDDHVQAAAIEYCLGPFLAHSFDEGRTLFVRERLVHSTSWRARLALAKQLSRIHAYVSCEDDSGRAGSSTDMDMDSGSGMSSGARASGKTVGTFAGVDSSLDPSLAELRATLLELFTDPEPDVRAEAAKYIAHFVGPDDGYTSALVDKLLEDDDREVRLAALSAVPQLAQRGFPSRVAQLLTKVVIGDPDPEVRTAAVETFFAKSLVQLLGDADRLEVIRKIYESSTSAEAPVAAALTVFNWRAKNIAVKALPLAISSLPSQVWTSEANGIHFLTACLHDPVHTVRATALAQIPHFAQVYGQDWVKLNLCPLPEVLFSKGSKDYHVRITAIELLHELYKIQCFSDANARLVRSATIDQVPNVKAKVAKLFPE